MSTDKHYPTDLTDEQWQVIEPLLPSPTWHPGGRGRPPVERRRVINGILGIFQNPVDSFSESPGGGRMAT